jgi:hypothetical protein
MELLCRIRAPRITRFPGKCPVLKILHGFCPVFFLYVLGFWQFLSGLGGKDLGTLCRVSPKLIELWIFTTSVLLCFVTPYPILLKNDVIRLIICGKHKINVWFADFALSRLGRLPAIISRQIWIKGSHNCNWHFSSVGLNVIFWLLTFSW